MTPTIETPRLILGGVASGTGKTTITVAIIAALHRRGLSVAPFKVGPDYLDPGYHRLAAERPSRNLDGWMMGREAVLSSFARSASGCDLALIEGVMGLFDGASSASKAGSTAEIAEWLQAPTVLVVDAGGMARSYAALSKGYACFDPSVIVQATIANRVGSQGHLNLLREACSNHAQVPSVLGGFPKNVDFSFPERHLGLVTATTSSLDQELLEQLAETAEEWIDLDRLLELASSAASIELPVDHSSLTTDSRQDCRIGIAEDPAFQFYYEENLHLLEKAGAEIVRFSPMTDEHLPAVDGLYIGGGYPELFAEQLASNSTLRAEIRAFVEADQPVYAECGGMMYLQRNLRTLDGREHAMVGVFDGSAVMQPKRVALGYVEVEIAQECLLGTRGTRFRGHQFRYSTVTGCTAPSVYSLRSRRGRSASPDAYSYRRAVGSYVHGHWASHPAIAQRFVDTCRGARCS